MRGPCTAYGSLLQQKQAATEWLRRKVFHAVLHRDRLLYGKAGLRAIHRLVRHGSEGARVRRDRLLCGSIRTTTIPEEFQRAHPRDAQGRERARSAQAHMRGGAHEPLTDDESRRSSAKSEVRRLGRSALGRVEPSDRSHRRRRKDRSSGGEAMKHARARRQGRPRHRSRTNIGRAICSSWRTAARRSRLSCARTAPAKRSRARIEAHGGQALTCAGSPTRRP